MFEQSDACYDYLSKVIVVGDSETGKSNILSRFTHDTFRKEFQTTIGVEFGTKQVDIGGKKIKAQVWDTAGQEMYMAITSSYYRGAAGVMIVYDITNRSTFDKVNIWLAKIKDYGNDGLPILLVGNKSDMESKREVSQREAMEYAEKNTLLFIETSALNSTNVETAFRILLTEIFKYDWEATCDTDSVPDDTPQSHSTLGSNDRDEPGAAVTNCESIPEWGEELIREGRRMKEQLQVVGRLEQTVEAMQKKIEFLENKVTRLEAKKVDFKVAHARSVKK